MYLSFTTFNFVIKRKGFANFSQESANRLNERLSLAQVVVVAHQAQTEVD